MGFASKARSMTLQRTPLFAFHSERGARMVPFAGWEMPVQYSSILEEHSRVRETVGIFDVSHMGQFKVSGTGATAFLDFVCSSNMAGAPVGTAKYAVLCNETGGAVDDLICYRIAEQEWLLIVNASNIDKDFAWMEARMADFEVSLENDSTAWALLAVQGPNAIEQLKGAGLEVPEGRFTHIATTWQGADIRVCRTGYTGEDGVECLIPAESAVAFAEGLESIFGKEAWCGLGARDSLRLEAGLPLYGHELTEELGPIEARMKWAVDFAKTDFVGKTALGGRVAASDRKIVKLFATKDRRIARQGTSVVDAEGNVLGEVLSGSMSPALQKGIGSAIVPFGYKSEAFVEIRGKQMPIAWKKSLMG